MLLIGQRIQMEQQSLLGGNDMQRIIKFRVWDKERKGFLHQIDIDSDIIYVDTRWYIHGGNALDDNYIMQQYTGMKDKGGTEIYEGDILSEKQWNGREIFGEVKWVSKIDGYDWSGWYSYPVSLPRHSGTECVVIGNIFENPELLK